jgi:geranylgeranyl diphosphate synthase type I
MQDSEALKQKIDQAISEFIDLRITQAKEISQASELLMKNIKEFSLRKGKRIRPLFVVYGFKCFAEGSEDEIIKVSISTELLHDYLLIHDDIMDKSDLRRGLPTFHKGYEKIYAGQNISNPAPYAENSAILAGDILSAISPEPILESSFPEDLKVNAVKKFNETNCQTGFGQELDILLELNKNAKAEDVDLVHILKTAKYTVESPLHIGAILAGATNEQLKTLSDYAIPAGRAFQIQDDVLGVFGSEEKIGKPVDSDLKEGKKTLLTIHALEKANPEQKKRLLEILGNQNISMKDVEDARKIIEETGSLEHSKTLAKELANQALEVVKSSDFRQEGKDFLIAIADKLVNRED